MPGDLRGARRRRHPAGRGRRAVVVHDGAQPRGRRRAQCRTWRHHVLLAGGLRRWCRLRDGPARGDGDRVRTVRGRDRLASEEAGREVEPPVGTGLAAARRPLAVEPSVRLAATGRRGRDAHAPVHARVRRDPRPARERRDRLPQAREPQPRGDHARARAHPGAVPGGTVDLGAALSVRQLPRDRRRACGRARRCGACEGPRADDRCSCTPRHRGFRSSTRR